MDLKEPKPTSVVLYKTLNTESVGGSKKGRVSDVRGTAADIWKRPHDGQNDSSLISINDMSQSRKTQREKKKTPGCCEVFPNGSYRDNSVL